MTASAATPAPHARESVWRPLVVGAAIAAVLLAAFLALAASLGSPVVRAFDESVLAAVQSVRSGALTALTLRVTDFGDTTLVLIITALTIAHTLRRRRWRAALLVVAVVGVGRLLGSVAQNVVGRTRPVQSGALIALPTTLAFPSGHSITATLLYGVLAFLLWRGLKVAWQRDLALSVCIGLVIAIGLTRIYLGVHWPTDVVAGMLLGGAWLSLMCGAYLSWERRAASRDQSLSPPARGRRPSERTMTP